jgi:hypothetical protein
VGGQADVPGHTRVLQDGLILARKKAKIILKRLEYPNARENEHYDAVSPV